MSDVLTAIQDFSAMTLQRLRGELPLESRAQLDALEEMLREQIEGARPAPRRLENPTAVSSVSRPSGPAVKPAQVVVTRREPGSGPSVAPGTISVAPAPAGGSVAPSPRVGVSVAPAVGSVSVAPAGVGIAPAPGGVSVAPAARAGANTAPPAGSVSPAAASRAFASSAAAPRAPVKPTDLVAELKLSSEDRGKLSEVRARDIPRSSYTPPQEQPYLDDYYEGEASNSNGADGEVTRLVVRGDGPPPDVKLLFNAREIVQRIEVDILDVDLGPPPAPITAARARTDSETQAGGDEPTRATGRRSLGAAARPSGPPSSGRPPAAIHLQGGAGALRGEVVTLDLEESRLTVRTASGDETIDLATVLVILYGVARGARPTLAEGTALGVRLNSGQELTGVSPDYAPGAPAMTLVPAERKGAIDRLWIPAWSVEEIRFLE